MFRISYQKESSLAFCGLMAFSFTLLRSLHASCSLVGYQIGNDTRHENRINATQTTNNAYIKQQDFVNVFNVNHAVVSNILFQSSFFTSCGRLWPMDLL